MTPDYLDLLLDRATGAVPLAEPRLAPALSAADAPMWEEISAEIVGPADVPSPASQRYVEQLPVPSTGPSLRVVESVRVAEMPQPVQMSKPRAASSRDSATSTASPSAHRLVETQETAMWLDPQTHSERSSPASEAPSAHPGVRNGQTEADQHSSETAPEKLVERTIQTQRWLPTLPSAEMGIGLDRLISSPSAPAQAPEPAPISIRIDRIEVRAGGSSLSPIAPPKPRPAAPLGLEEYLKRKSGGGR